MTFIEFARLHGILINSMPSPGNWERYATEDHPVGKKNGAVKYLITHGFVKNHATDDEVSVWFPDVAPVIKTGDAQILRKAGQDIEMKQRQAASKAAILLKQSKYMFHPYLRRKGFPEDEGNVIVTDGGLVLLVPMRVSGRLVGLQQISEKGEKRFLYGQRSAGASFCFDNKGTNILCEGYATALSARQALKHLKRRYTLHVCFSAANLVKIAAEMERGIVIADNDESGVGEASAKKTGWPFWMSDCVGQDFNDFHRSRGLFRASASLSKLFHPTVST